MEGDELRVLMNRLRFAAGKANEAPVVDVPLTRINEKCLLVFQQALCRHPSLTAAHKSRDELKKVVMEQICDSLRVENDSTDEVCRLLGWINDTSEALEAERLSAVYHDSLEVLHDVKQRAVKELGVEALPDLLQCCAGDLSPWNVLFTLVFGPILTFDETRHRRTEIHLLNPTPAMIEDIVRINENVYSTTSWISLLNSLVHFPIKTVRHVWLAATFFFPTCGPIVVAYLLKEIEEVAKRRFLWDERDEDDAKETCRSYCRILNCFFRHLTLCFSVDLFRLFFDFLERYIKPDNATLDNIFKTALQKYIGHSPASGDLWKRYIQWKSDKIHDSHQRREWIRKMYVRVLRTPLNGLGEIKEDYDFFVKSEYRGRPPSEGRLEERFLRAKGVAGELNRFMGTFGDNHGGEFLPRLLYLPRPVKLVEDTFSEVVVSDRESVMRRLEVETWAQWTFLIDREIASSAYIGMELFGYERVRFFFAMRTSLFPHQAYSWISFADYCLGQQPLLLAAERQQMARDILEKALFLLVKNFHLQVAYCDYMLWELEQPDCAHRSMRDMLIQQREIVVGYIKKASGINFAVVLAALERIALLSINWMRWGSLRNEVTKTHHIRLVARFTMQHVDFLSLVMGVIRHAAREDQTFTPCRSLRAFSTFCHFWIKLELIRNQAKKEAVLILERWKDHMKMFLKSAKGRLWSLNDCGVDEYFISSCIDVGSSNPTAVREILKFINELRLTAIEVGSFSIIDVEETIERNLKNIRDMFFLVDEDDKGPSGSAAPLQYFIARLRGRTVPLQTYDHHFFSAAEAWHEQRGSFWAQLAEERGVVAADFCTANVSSQLCYTVDTMPDDTRWAPCSAACALKSSSFSSTAPAAGAHGGQKAAGDNEVKYRKSRRPPNRRALIAVSNKLKDLSLAIQIQGTTSTVRKLEKLLTVYLPSTYETDFLFSEKTVDTDWLLDFIEYMPATQ